MNLKKVKENKKFIMIVFSVSIIAVMLVPMLYSFIYLNSVWDVYGNLDNVAVAFVNLDKSVTKDGKEYAIGKEIENSLKDSKTVAWDFVSYEEAMEGVEGTEYYAVIEIPEDFSEKIANAKDGSFNNPEIIYIGNKGKNFVFSQISLKVANSIKAEVSSNIQKEISKALVDSLYDVKVSIKDAGNGAEELQAGTQKLLDGSKELVIGMEKAASGSLQLENGLNQAAEASVKLQDGTQKLFNGSNDLSNGLNEAAVGSKQLLAALKEISNGQSQVASGSSALVDGLNYFKSNLTKSNDQIPVLLKGALDVSNNTTLIRQGSEQLNTNLNVGLNALADGVKQSGEGISQVAAIMNAEIDNINNSNLSQVDKDKLTAAIMVINNINNANISANIEEPLRKAANSAQPLVSSLIQLEAGSKQVSDGVHQLASGLNDTQNKAAVALDKLISGANGIQSGANSILEGLNTVTDKTGVLVNGLDILNSGSMSLKDGLKTVNDGNISLKEGLNNAAMKTGQLSDGLKELSNGSTSLKNGLGDANDGAIMLKDGLNNGYYEMNDSLKFNSTDMSQFISEPITLKDSSINNVKYYGEGLEPYFISMSLWLGAMLMGMIFSFAKILNVFKSKFMNSFIGKFIVGSGLVTMQALILSFVLLKGLESNPVSIIWFYLSNVFISIVFFSISYGVSHAFGIIASPIMFIVLLLQLSSSGGTFPVETAPKFYGIVGKVVPMTYSINTLRMVISGINLSLLKQNISIMLIFMIISLGGGLLIRELLNIRKNRSVTIN
jgi:putative membrane protein